MEKNEKAKEIFEDIPIPERLLPENIAIMLKEKTKGINNDIEKIPQEVIIHEENSAAPAKKRRKISVASRAIATIAACAVLAVGVTAFLRNGNKPLPTIKNAGVTFDTELAPVADYTQLYNTFQKINVESSKTHYTASDFFSGIFGGGKNYTDEATTATSPAMPENALGTVDTTRDGTSETYSETHQQVEGVSEADIIKTDGKNIYYIANGTLYIVKSDNGKMTLLSKTIKENITAREMFIVNNKLILISEKYEPIQAQKTTPSGTAPAPAKSGATTPSKSVEGSNGNNALVDTICPTYIWNDTLVEIYDISDATNPKVINSYSQKGGYVSSRMIDTKFFLVTNYANYLQSPITDEKDIDKFVPTYCINDQKSYIEPKDIDIPQKVDNTNYTIIAGLDITAEKPLVSIKALLGYNGTVYSSKDNLYVAGQNWSDNSQETTIARFSLNNGNLTHTGFGKVDGVILNQFSMDEYEGNFRLATTSYDYKKNKQTNSVFVLDKNLKQIGSLTGIADTETIQSVRFDKTTGYVVTFRQTDPLFTIDFSDPKQPKIMSELKSNGYSTYLINYGEGKLLGFGVDADEKGRQTSLKLSMFKTDDSKNVSEITKINLGDDLQNAFSCAIYDHKALLIDATKNLIGIPVSFFDGIDQCNRFYLLSYSDAEGFKILGKAETHDVSGAYQFTRGMYIGDVVYAFAQGRIVVSKSTDMSVISTLYLVKPTSIIQGNHGVSGVPVNPQLKD